MGREPHGAADHRDGHSPLGDGDVLSRATAAHLLGCGIRRRYALGGIVAPPDFNPFAWPVERPRGGPSGLAGEHPEGRPLTGMNGGQTDTYGAPMRPGDVISARSRLVDWWEREGRLGHTLYVRSEIEWRNQNDELVKTRLSISIRY